MDPVVALHVALALLLLAGTLVVGVWGLARAASIAAPGGGGEARLFSHLLQLTHSVVAATGLAGLVLMAEGHEVADPLHVRVYGPFMLVAVVAAYGFRSADHRANVRVFAVCSLVIFALALRAATTGM